MDYSASNTQLWNSILQMTIIIVPILVANILRRKIKFIRSMMMPTAVFGGFLLLAVKAVGLIEIDTAFFEYITYHAIAIGFIAMSLRVPEDAGIEKGDRIAMRSGAVIVGSYMIQGVFGLLISLGLSYTIMPDLFKAAGLLLPMGYGQGPGQANNIGASYEALGFAGGRAFGLSIAAAGYISACVVGVAYMTWLVKKGKMQRVEHDEVSGSVTVDTFQHDNEMPIAESMDKFSMQAALVFLVYGATYLVSWGVTSLLTAYAPGLANMLNSLIWGFNFMIGSGLAIGLRVLFKGFKKVKLMNHQYQNNYLLSRFSGLAFDIMIVAGIGSIEIKDIKRLFLPFILMSIAGAFVTLIHLRFVCKRVYGDYYYEGLLSMYGMMTGTISSGVLLLREIDPFMKTPAANNLVVGSSFAIIFGAPFLALISLAPKSPAMTFIVFVCLAIYYVLLLLIACKGGKRRKKD